MILLQSPTVPDSIVPAIIEPSSLPADIAEIRGILTRIESKIDGYITHFTDLEDKLVDHPDLHQTPVSSFLSLPGTVQHLSTRLTHCELNHESVIQKFCNCKKDVQDFLGMGTHSYMNFSNL